MTLSREEAERIARSRSSDPSRARVETIELMDAERLPFWPWPGVEELSSGKQRVYFVNVVGPYVMKLAVDLFEVSSRERAQDEGEAQLSKMRKTDSPRTTERYFVVVDEHEGTILLEGPRDGDAV